jgi:hypothetical protein
MQVAQSEIEQLQAQVAQLDAQLKSKQDELSVKANDTIAKVSTEMAKIEAQKEADALQAAIKTEELKIKAKEIELKGIEMIINMQQAAKAPIPQMSDVEQPEPEDNTESQERIQQTLAILDGLEGIRKALDALNKPKTIDLDLNGNPIGIR